MYIFWGRIPGELKSQREPRKSLDELNLLEYVGISSDNKLLDICAVNYFMIHLFRMSFVASIIAVILSFG